MSFQVNTKKIAKNTISLYIRQIITMFISFFTVRVTLNQLGVEDYGLNNLVGSIVSMFSFINGSMGTAVQRFYSYEIGKNNQGSLKRIFGTGLYLHLLVALITLVISEVFAFFFLERMNIPRQRLFAAQVVFQISIFTLILGIITVPYSALLRSRELFSKTALIEVIQAFLRLANLSLLVFLSFDKLIVLSILNLMVSAAGILAFVLLARKFEETHTYPIYDKTIIRQMMKFVSLLLLTVLSSLVNTQGIVMLINIFFGLTVNAAYAVAVQVQNAVNTFVTNFKASMVPQIMASYGAGDFKTMHTMIDIGTKITFVMLLMVTYPLMFSAQWILTVWLKNPPEYSASLVIFTLISINIGSFTYVHGQGIHASGDISKQQIWLSSTYLGTIVITFILFKIGMNFYTALFINMGIGILQNIVNVYYATKCFNYSLKNFVNNILSRVCLFTVITLCIFLIEYRLAITEISKFIVFLITDMIIVPILSFVIVFNKDERGFVHTLLLNKFSKISLHS